MTLTLELTEDEQEGLEAASPRNGMDPSSYANQLIHDHLPTDTEARVAGNSSQGNVGPSVLCASLGEAEYAINDETRIVLSVEEYDRLVTLMDEATPATPRPRLQ